MIDRLVEGPASVSDLAAPLPMTLAAVVQHVQVLETSGLITTEKVGRVRTCRVDAPALGLLQRWVDERCSLWEQRLDRLGEVLTEQTKPSNQRPDNHQPDHEEP